MSTAPVTIRPMTEEENKVIEPFSGKLCEIGSSPVILTTATELIDEDRDRYPARNPHDIHD